jgi:hypothetical protein
MFSLTNVGLSMCVKEYSDLFLNLMIEYIVSQSWYLCLFKGIISRGGKKFVKVPAWREKFEKIPAWWDKVGILFMLINPAWREKFGIVLILHGGRKLL